MQQPQRLSGDHVPEEQRVLRRHQQLRAVPQEGDAPQLDDQLMIQLRVRRAAARAARAADDANQQSTERRSEGAPARRRSRQR